MSTRDAPPFVDEQLTACNVPELHVIKLSCKKKSGVGNAVFVTDRPLVCFVRCAGVLLRKEKQQRTKHLTLGW